MFTKTGESIRMAVLLIAPASVCLAQQDYAKTCNADAAFGSARELLARKAYDRAAKELDAVRACPALSNLQTFEMGWLYGRARRFDVALEIFNKLPEDVPDRLTHGYALALARFELSDFQGAAAVLNGLRASGIADAKSINLLAVSYSKLGLYREAYAVLAKEADSAPGDLSTWLNLATVCAEGGDYTKAAEVAEKAVQLFPQSADVFIVRGAAGMLLGHVERSAEDFATAVRLAPLRADARFFLAVTKYDSGDFAGALQVLHAAASAGIADADVHYLAAECLLKADPANAAAALEELDRAIALNSASVAARTLRGKLLLEAGRTKEAVADLEIANRADPDSRSAIYNLTKAYRLLGKTAEARALSDKLKPDAARTTAADNPVQEFTEHRLKQAVIGQGGQP